MRRLVWWAGGISVAVAGVAAVAWQQGIVGARAAPPEATAPAPAAARPVRVTTVRLAPAGETARYAAVIRPRVEAEFGFRVEGKLAQRLVDVGERVEAGAALARLDPVDLELRVAAAEAQLRSAEAEAANARLELARYRELRGKGWSTKQELEARAATQAVADARISEAAAQLRIARNNLAYASLTADTAGVITTVLAEPGQVVEIGDPILRVARAGELEAEVEVPEQGVVAFRDAALAVSLWARPKASFAGRLRELSLSADRLTRTYTARVALDEPPDWVRLGMTATVSARGVEVGMRTSLPPSALTQEGSAPAVWVLSAAGDRVALRPVTVAAFAPDGITVSGGLFDGERVVTAGVHKLDAGQRVRVWAEPQR